MTSNSKWYCHTTHNKPTICKKPNYLEPIKVWKGNNKTKLIK